MSSSNEGYVSDFAARPAGPSTTTLLRLEDDNQGQSRQLLAPMECTQKGAARMPKICYVARSFSRKTQTIIDQANGIIGEYAAQDFDLTVRQLYYQFVARGLLPNSQKNYKRLGSIVNDARLAGLIDWNRITDRTRNLESLSHWESPKDILSACASQFRLDKWEGQTYRPEVWIEKEALAGVFERVCKELDVPYFSCRGYTSQSEMWAAGQRLKQWSSLAYTPIIFHFGDHDPSGIDMTRDIEDRLQMFVGGIELQRLALNMDQVGTYKPPPNPAKTTDSRYANYIKVHGHESWELDALDPTVLANLVRNAIGAIRDEVTWNCQVSAEEEHKRLLVIASNKWHDITKSKAFRKERPYRQN
jgi:hypothetical protein